MAGGPPVIVFSRADSRRLPGKALLDIAGRSLLGRVLDRLGHGGGGTVIVATSVRPVDDGIAAFAEAEGYGVFRGDGADVSARALACAEANGLDWFVRVSGDSPFIDPAVVARVADLYRCEEPDLATNVFPRSFPAGCSAEAIRVDALRRAMAESAAPGHREHVTTYFYEHPDRFRIVNAASGRTDLAGRSLAVDTESDLAIARWIAARLPRPDQATLGEILALHGAWSRTEASGA